MQHIRSSSESLVDVQTVKITRKLAEELYNPTTWRTHELHLCPPARGARGDPLTKDALNWLFLVSALNFSFWSDLEGTTAEPARYGVDWRAGWESDERRVWTGYWSLVAAIDRGEIAVRSLCGDALPDSNLLSTGEWHTYHESCFLLRCSSVPGYLDCSGFCGCRALRGGRPLVGGAHKGYA